jgi:hypothetical protein
VPTACERVLQNNAVSSVKINLVGLLEGNAWTDMPLDNLGAIDTWQQRMIVSCRMCVVVFVCTTCVCMSVCVVQV